MKILISGCAGFIGYHLTKELISKSYDVLGLDNLNEYYDLNLKKDRLEFVPSKDLEKNESLINLDEGDVDAQLDEYAGVIDYLDIIEVNKMNLVNEKAIVSDDSFIREAFKFNLFL